MSANARIRHIGLWSDDPPKTAEFYKTHLGLKELFRKPADTGADGVWLSDGYIYFAVTKTKSGGSSGISHIGFNVDDLEATCSALNSRNVAPGEFIRTEPSPIKKISNEKNRKFIGPDGVKFDLRCCGWDDAIKNRMQLYQLTPAPPADETSPTLTKINASDAASD